MNDTHNLAMHIWRKTAPKLTLDDCENVLGALAKLGYVLEPGGDARTYVGTGDYTALAKEITRNVQVHHLDALLVFTGLNHMQYQIKKPTKEATT